MLYLCIILYNDTMRVIKNIRIGLIQIDHYPMNPTVLSLIDYIRSGGSIPPIHVSKNRNGTFSIRDGRHRILAYKLLGKSEIKAKFSTKINIKS